MSMHEQEKKNLCVLKDFIKRMKRLELKIKIIKSDNEMSRKKKFADYTSKILNLSLLHLIFKSKTALQNAQKV